MRANDPAGWVAKKQGLAGKVKVKKVSSIDEMERFYLQT